MGTNDSQSSVCNNHSKNEKLTKLKMFDIMKAVFERITSIHNSIC